MVHLKSVDSFVEKRPSVGGKNVPDPFRSFFLSSPVALAVVGIDGSVLTNRACREFLAAAVGSNPRKWDRWLTGALTRMAVEGKGQDVVRGPGKESGDIHLTVGQEVSARGHRVLALRRADFSERKAESLSDTVNTLAHELRSPLTAMKTSLKLVLGEETGPLNEDQHHFLGITLRNIDRLDRLVSDLLDTSRAASGSLPLKATNGDLMPILRELLDSQAESARQAGLDFVMEKLPKALLVRVDQDKVVQMLANVLGNAVKYTPRGGKIAVEVHSNPATGRFSIEVQDNGTGMDKKALALACEPFQRVHDEEKSKIPGSGLGLHITRGLAKAHGGELRLSSEPGLGTTVTIELPLILVDEPAPFSI